MHLCSSAKHHDVTFHNHLCSHYRENLKPKGNNRYIQVRFQVPLYNNSIKMPINAHNDERIQM